MPKNSHNCSFLYPYMPYSGSGRPFTEQFPHVVNNATSLESQKSALIVKFPGKPSVPGYTPPNSNSLLDWCVLKKMEYVLDTDLSCDPWQTLLEVSKSKLYHHLDLLTGQSVFCYLLNCIKKQTNSYLTLWHLWVLK